MNQTKSPEVTVLMPVYNGEKYLKEAMDSILNQTFTDFEFLIINDGSKDKSLEIINAYSDPRIRVIHNDINAGLVSTLNKGIDLAYGKFIARMDCDDISMPDRLQKQYDFMQQNTDCSVVGSWAQTIDAQGRITGDIKTLTSPDCISVELFFTNPIIHSSTFIDKDFITSIGGYDNSYERAEDYHLWIRTVEKNGGILNIPDFLLKYRVHSDNVSNAFVEKQEEVAWDAMQYAYSSLINEKVSTDNLALLRSCYFYKKELHHFTDTIKEFIILRQFKKILRKKFLNNQNALDYLENRINSIVDSQAGSQLKKYILKNALLNV